MIDIGTIAVIAFPSACAGAFAALALRECYWRTSANEWRELAYGWRDECYKIEANSRTITKGPTA